MIKKVLGISILVGLTAVLIFGAINRTQAKNSDHETRPLASGAGTYRQGGGQGAGQGAFQPGIRNQGGYDQQPLAGGNPQAEVDNWTSVEGTVMSADSSQVLVTLSNGEALEIAGRAWSYAQENSFSMQNGDQLRLTGFYEDNELEIGTIENLTNGTTIRIREQSGRSLWAGRGRQG
jgi:hypothetical protein